MLNIKGIKKSNELLIPADKLRNIYIVQDDDYKEYIRDNATKIYKNSTANRVKKINYK